MTSTTPSQDLFQSQDLFDSDQDLFGDNIDSSPNSTFSDNLQVFIGE